MLIHFVLGLYSVSAPSTELNCEWSLHRPRFGLFLRLQLLLAAVLLRRRRSKQRGQQALIAGSDHQVRSKSKFACPDTRFVCRGTRTPASLDVCQKFSRSVYCVAKISVVQSCVSFNSQSDMHCKFGAVSIVVVLTSWQELCRLPWSGRWSHLLPAFGAEVGCRSL